MFNYKENTMQAGRKSTDQMKTQTSLFNNFNDRASTMNSSSHLLNPVSGRSTINN